MGAAGSKLEKALGDQFPEGERFFGFENFGNTCYCNSVLQALYFCVPFREQLLEYYTSKKSVADAEENLMTCLADLFSQISSQKKKTGVIAPKRFVQRLKKQNELFRSYMHQDAHEFLNYLLNEVVDILEKESKATKTQHETSSSSSPEKIANGFKVPQANGVHKEPIVTWVHNIFQGILTNETRCLRCETVTARDETFLDLSLDIEQNSSITSCLKNFSSTETLHSEDKFFCDRCCSLQEAQKRMKIKKPPHILVIHLKRFKYIEQLGRYKKLSYRVVFPLELKLSNTVEPYADEEYSLFAVVVHVGSGPNHGHYVSLVKSHNHWLLFDDENVEIIEESSVQTFFGSSQEYSSNTDHGYILFYETTLVPTRSVHHLFVESSMAGKKKKLTPKSNRRKKDDGGSSRVESSMFDEEHDGGDEREIDDVCRQDSDDDDAIEENIVEETCNDLVVHFGEGFAEEENMSDGDSGDDIWDDEKIPSPLSSDDDEETYERIEMLANTLDSEEYLFLGKTYGCAADFKVAVLRYSLKTGYDIKLYKSTTKRLGAKCNDVEKECGWRVYCSYVKRKHKMQIKVYINEHSCMRSGYTKMLKVSSIAMLFSERLRLNPKLTKKDMVDEIKREYNMIVTEDQCAKAKSKLYKERKAGHEAHFSRLWDYQAQVLKTNQHTTIDIETIPGATQGCKQRFNRIYICFTAQRESWIESCRPIIGLDGAFLKRAHLEIEMTKLKAKDCKRYMACGDLHEVDDKGTAYSVDMVKRTCGCMKWQITGMPCIHAACVIVAKKQSFGEFVSNFYTARMWKLTYSRGIKPVDGMKLWPRLHRIPLLPPPFRLGNRGRPKNYDRRKGVNETSSTTKKTHLTNEKRVITCSHCLEIGHNKSTCSNEAAIPAPKRPRGRPRTEYTGEPQSQSQSHSQARSQSHTPAQSQAHSQAHS